MEKVKKQKKKALKPINPLIYSFFYHTVGKFLRASYNLEVENPELLEALAPPFLVVSHHVNSLDPFFIGFSVRAPLYWIASDSNFRNPLIRFLLHRVRAIPKRKFLSDNDAIRKIMEVRKLAGIIGVFPEGQSSWDGRTLPILPSTGKLIKLLKIPVITVKLFGSYLIKPRWRRYRRYGKVALRFSHGFSREEIKSSSVEEINEKLQKLLFHDEAETQKERMLPFPGKNRAEYAERLLFICPRCMAVGTLVSRENILSCSRCGMEKYYSEYGILESQNGENGKEDFSSPSRWNEWQQKQLRTIMNEPGAKETILFQDRNILLSRGKPPGKPQGREKIEVMWMKEDTVTCVMNNGSARMDFPASQITGINVQNSGNLEFYFKQELYSFRFSTPSASPYKWQIAVEIVQEIQNSKRINV